jgi:hypothetical protein
MAVWVCGSSAHCCQPGVAGGFIYADLRSELNTHLAPVTATSCPLPKHTGWVDTASAFSDQHVYLQFTWEVDLPPSCEGFFPLPLLQAFSLLVAGWVLPLLPSPAGLFIYSSMGVALPPFFGSQGIPPSLLCVFFVVIAYYSVFFLFSLGWGGSV